MSNGVRHALGAVVGVVGIPVIYVLLGLGTEQMIKVRSISATTFESPPLVEVIPGLGLFILVAIAIGLSAGSRLSPLASLIPGVAFTGLGTVITFTYPLTAKVLSSFPWGFELINLQIFGVPVLIGAILLTGSALPSRWRRSRPGINLHARPDGS